MAKRQLSDEQRRQSVEAKEADRLETEEEASRVDSAGRELYPWEADPADQEQERVVQVEEGGEGPRQQRRDTADEQQAAPATNPEPTATEQTS